MSQHDLEPEIAEQLARLERRLDRERGARREAEAIAEKATRRLYRAVEQLTRVNKDLDEFAYVASHDLRSPLRAIDALASWIDEDAGDTLGAEPREHLRLMRQRVQRMDALLDGLLKYARAGRTAAIAEKIDIAELVTEVGELLERPATFRIEAEIEVPVIDSVRAPLLQTLNNLITNAIKHHDRVDGRVVVRCRTLDAQFVSFEVEDDGPGIPDELRERVFQVFQTLKRADEVEGSGMGLAIVKKQVSAAGGSIDVLDGQPRGVCFRFSWPSDWEVHDR